MFVLSILVVVLLLYLMNISGRVSRLELLLKQKSEIAPAVKNDQKEAVKAPQREVSTNFVQQNYEPDIADKFVAWLKEEWLMKLGALFLLMGLGWFVRYAFLHNWIGPYGRITMGMVLGVVVLVLGWLRIQKFAHQGGVLLVLGSTSIILTLFAAREVYNFFTPFSTLSVMFLSTVFVAFASIRFRLQWLALASLVLAGAAPLFTNPPQPNMVGLFTYLLVVTLGSIWVAVLSGYREMTLGALVLLYLYSFPQFKPYNPDKEILLIFSYAFAIIFFITNTASIVRGKLNNLIWDLVVAGGNGLLLLSWILFAGQEDLKSLIISAWMVVFAIGAYLVFRISEKRVPFYVYGGVALMFLAAATSSELNGSTLTIAYTIESAIVSLVLYAVINDLRIVGRSHLLFLGPGFLSLISIFSGAWNKGVFNKDFFVLLVLAVVLLGLGTFYRKQIKLEKPELKDLYVVLLIIGSAYAYILVWLSFDAAFPRAHDTAVMISLVLYTIAGLVKYFYGIATKNPVIRNYGYVLLGGVVGRLLLIDVWKMELVGKVITFLFIGTLLLSTALYSRKKIFQNQN